MTASSPSFLAHRRRRPTKYSTGYLRWISVFQCFQATTHAPSSAAAVGILPVWTMCIANANLSLQIWTLPRLLICVKVIGDYPGFPFAGTQGPPRSVRPVSDVPAQLIRLAVKHPLRARPTNRRDQGFQKGPT